MISALVIFTYYKSEKSSEAAASPRPLETSEAAKNIRGRGFAEAEAAKNIRGCGLAEAEADTIIRGRGLAEAGLAPRKTLVFVHKIDPSDLDFWQLYSWPHIR